MTFIADLHIHSRYSRATARNLDLEHIYQAAQFKGISVVGTGDFTHPEWINEIKEKLVEAEPGLFTLRPEQAGTMDRTVPAACRQEVRFILQTEISNIYKKNGRVRKNHNLIFFPDIHSVERFTARLDRIGNIKSDGRPILGLDSRDLLEIMLEINPAGVFVPAHIWTPWFSLFGSKSGFDTIEECFGPLSDHIFAVETGLSSDPPMNWRVPQLDNRRLISNSDAHSPGFLGRNASVFDTDLNFFHIRDSLAEPHSTGYTGTLDMYPEEGKYHYDGHRKCGQCLNPEETAACGGVCPKCGRPLTLGVLHRVRELARRPEGFVPENRHGFRYIIPLTDILSEIFQKGPKTKKVTEHYFKALELLGPELAILLDRSEDELRRTRIPLLAEAVGKMRSGRVTIEPGYDGEYGKVRLFSAEERERAGTGTRKLFTGGHSDTRAGTRTPASRNVTDRYALKGAPESKKPVPGDSQHAAGGKPAGPDSRSPIRKPPDRDLIHGLNRDQKRAVLSDARRIIIEAGPGTGKTRTLTARMAYLISEKKVKPAHILALTFTRKAAGEIRQRIGAHLSGPENAVFTGTFHSFCLSLLQEEGERSFSIVDDPMRAELIREAQQIEKTTVKDAGPMISLCRQNMLTTDDPLDSMMPPEEIHAFKRVWSRYDHLCRTMNILDFDSLIPLTVRMLNDSADLLNRVRDRFRHILVDEYQDINKGQYHLTRLISETGHLFIIGDPDQSIYGFRGSDNRYFDLFTRENPDAERYTLTRNYRSTQTILDASFQMITQKKNAQGKEKIFSDIQSGRNLIIRETANSKAEAAAVGKTIEALMGGTSFFSMDAGKADISGCPDLSFSDFAVLYRTKRQAHEFIRAFDKHGIPCQTADREDRFSRPGVAALVSLLRVISDKASFSDLERLFDLYKVGLGPKGKTVFRRWFFSRHSGSGPLTDLLAGIELPGLSGKVTDGIAAVAADLKSLAPRSDSAGLAEMIRTAAARCRIEPLIMADEKARETYSFLLALAAGCREGLGRFLDDFTLNQDIDLIDSTVEKVTLMTMHASKGLEFPVVFITGCEEGLIPYRSAASPGKKPPSRTAGSQDTDEERRLFYVAMTRAGQILYLTYARERHIFGGVKKQTRSRFLADIDRRLTETAKSAAGKLKKKQAAVQMELFQSTETE